MQSRSRAVCLRSSHAGHGEKVTPGVLWIYERIGVYFLGFHDLSITTSAMYEDGYI